MHTRTLGQGLQVSGVGLGAMGMSHPMVAGGARRDLGYFRRVLSDVVLEGSREPLGGGEASY